MTDTAEQAPAEEVSTNEQVVADAAAESQPQTFDFVLDKYRTDGRSEEEAALEQAKAYNELQSKFGAFTGSPEEYNVALDEALQEHINLDDYKDDPILEEAKEICRDMGMNEDGFNKMVGLYFKGELAGVEAADKVREEEMKLLGNNAERRLGNIQDWAKANLDADTSEALLGSLQSASTVQAIEAVIAKTRNVAQTQNAPAAPAVSADKAREAMLAKDEYGNPKMNDPAYAANVRKMYGQLYGEEPHSVTIGG